MTYRSFAALSVAALVLTACGGGTGSAGHSAGLLPGTPAQTASSATKVTTTIAPVPNNGAPSVSYTDYTLPNGLSSEGSVAFTKDGSVWTNAGPGMAQLQNDQVTTYTIQPPSGEFLTGQSFFTSTPNGKVWTQVNESGDDPDENTIDLVSVMTGGTPVDNGTIAELESFTGAIKTDASGDVWASAQSSGNQTSNASLAEYAQTGTKLGSVNLPNETITALSPGPGQTMWAFVTGAIVGATDVSSIDVYSQQRQLLATYPLPSTVSVNDAALGSDGNVYAVDSMNNALEKINATGVVVATYPLSTKNAKPLSIVLGGDGAMWFSESGANKIGRVTTGGSIAEYALPTASSIPSQLVGFDSGCGPSTLWMSLLGTGHIGQFNILTNT